MPDYSGNVRTHCAWKRKRDNLTAHAARYRLRRALPSKPHANNQKQGDDMELPEDGWVCSRCNCAVSVAEDCYPEDVLCDNCAQELVVQLQRVVNKGAMDELLKVLDKWWRTDPAAFSTKKLIASGIPPEIPPEGQRTGHFGT